MVAFWQEGEAARPLDRLELLEHFLGHEDMQNKLILITSLDIFYFLYVDVVKVPEAVQLLQSGPKFLLIRVE